MKITLVSVEDCVEEILQLEMLCARDMVLLSVFLCNVTESVHTVYMLNFQRPGMRALARREKACY